MTDEAQEALRQAQEMLERLEEAVQLADIAILRANALYDKIGMTREEVRLMMQPFVELFDDDTIPVAHDGEPVELNEQDYRDALSHFTEHSAHSAENSN
ncbi:hypothetical protein [Noviherbaspirillum galbum]|uniref:Uncharacterized protein n=1 Tax=Noviherbaspirillum galbum TaxID=2709383 RepID=A0A6B3STU0_9BURK|nr:hypothetical protein [Noviherbaspirillum galbum]NEX64213.1 hypothetical protein [Noviherbaspirillum galbum]